MKASEAILRVIDANGGKIKYSQFSEWLGELIKREYLELLVEGKDKSISFHVKIADKGKRLLERSKIL